MFRKTCTLLTCENGTATIESLLLATVLVTASLVGLSTFRAAVLAELSDVSGSLQDLNASYAFAGATGASASVAGSSFTDALDVQDSPEDVAGSADNCLVLSEPPESENVDPGEKASPVVVNWADSATNYSETGGQTDLYVWQGGGFRPRSGTAGELTVEGTTALDCEECRLGIEATWTVRTEESASRDHDESVELIVNGSSVGHVTNSDIPAGSGNRDISLNFVLPAGTTSFSWLMIFRGGDGLNNLLRIGVRSPLSFECVQ